MIGYSSYFGNTYRIYLSKYYMESYFIGLWKTYPENRMSLTALPVETQVIYGDRNNFQFILFIKVSCDLFYVIIIFQSSSTERLRIYPIFYSGNLVIRCSTINRDVMIYHPDKSGRCTIQINIAHIGSHVQSRDHPCYGIKAPGWSTIPTTIKSLI